MQCVVLAGGLATRMRPATERVPKWLLPVAGRPFAAWQLEWLAAGGVDSVVACLGHLAGRAIAEVGDGAAYGPHVRYSMDGDDLLGTGGALRQAATDGLLDPAFLVVYGDSYLPLDVGEVWDAFNASGRPGLMTVCDAAPGALAGNAAVRDGTVVRYEKGVDGDPELSAVDYGLSALRRDVLDDLPAVGPVDLGVVFSGLARRGELTAWRATEPFHEVGSPEGLAALDAHLRARGGAEAGG